MKHHRTMKLTRLVTLLATITLLVACYGYYQISGSGTPETRQLGYDNFTGISVGMGAKVTMTPAAGHSIHLTADDNIIDYVAVYPLGGGATLEFSLDDAFYYERHSISIQVNMPSIEEIDFGSTRHWYDYTSDDVNLTIESGFTLTNPFYLKVPQGRTEIVDLTADTAEISISSDSNLTANVTINDLTLLRGYGDVDLSGTVTSLDLQISGSSDDTVDLADAVVTDAVVDISSGVAVLNVTGTISGSVARDATLKYINNGGLDISGLQADEDATIVILPVP